MKKIFSIALICLMMMTLVLMAGCSQDNNDEDVKAEGEQKALVVGTEPTFPPFEMQDEKTGDIIGFDIDLIKAIGEDQGFKVEVQSMGFDALVNAVKTGSIDIVASGMTINETRAKEVDFSEPYINSGLALAVGAGNEDIKSVADLKGKTVSVQTGSTGEEKAKELKEQGLIEGYMPFDTVDIVMREVVSGNVVATITDLPVTEAYITKTDDALKIVEELTSEEYGFASQKGTDLKAKIDQGLKNVKENGKYDELIKKYFE